MAIITGSYHGGTGNWLRIQGGLRARVTGARSIDVEFAGDEAINASAIQVRVGGALRGALSVTRDASNSRLWHVSLVGPDITSSSGDIRFGLTRAVGNQAAFTTSSIRGLYLAYDGTDLTAAEAEYEEHIVPTNAINASKPTDPDHLRSLPSGGWSVICETPERITMWVTGCRIG